MKKPGTVPTIRDVARQAGVSVGTVSKVINDNPSVNAELRRRVQEVVAETGYRPSLVARALHTKRTRSLAFLVPSITNPFFAGVLHAVETAAHKEGYSVFVGSTEADPERVALYQERLLAMGVDGVLLVLSWDIVSGGLVPALCKQGLPVVGVAGSRIVADIDCFVPDDVAGGEMAAGYLLGLGHRRIAFLGTRDSRTTELRYAGVRHALTDFGIEHDPALVVHAPGFAEADGARAVHELIGRRTGFTAVVAFNDVLAVGALNALEDQGIGVPGRISLIGFDDTVSAYSRPKMTTVACPVAVLGERAVQRLLARLEGEDAPPTVHPVPMRFVVRSSTAVPNAADARRAAVTPARLEDAR